MQRRLVQAKLTHGATADGHDLLTIARAREEIVYRGRGNLDAAVTSTVDVSTQAMQSDPHGPQFELFPSLKHPKQL